MANHFPISRAWIVCFFVWSSCLGAKNTTWDALALGPVGPIFLAPWMVQDRRAVKKALRRGDGSVSDWSGAWSRFPRFTPKIHRFSLISADLHSDIFDAGGTAKVGSSQWLALHQAEAKLRALGIDGYGNLWILGGCVWVYIKFFFARSMSRMSRFKFSGQLLARLCTLSLNRSPIAWGQLYPEPWVIHPTYQLGCTSSRSLGGTCCPMSWLSE